MGTYNELQGLMPGNYYLPPYLIFETNSLDAPPGTYFLAIQFKAENEIWILAGSSFRTNPIYVIVKASDIHQDTYEPNNTIQTAYKLPVDFIENRSKIVTEGSNFHLYNDVDFYSVDLSMGYRYLLTVRVHDASSSQTGELYSADVMFSISTDGVTWSETFDEIMYHPFQLTGTQTLYFQIVPFFEGETGTYLFEVNIVRFPIVGTHDEKGIGKMEVYPNPASDIITVKLNNGVKIKGIQLFDITGRLVTCDWRLTEDYVRVIPVDQLPEGSYLLTVYSENMMVSKKIVICH